MSGKCPTCEQTVVAAKGEKVGIHTAKGKPGTCPGSGKTAK